MKVNMETLNPFYEKMRRGFTLIEVVIFAAVFSGMAVVFMTILVVVLRVQARESAVAEVSQQSHFLLRTIQDYVERSSLVELPDDVATSTLKVRQASSTLDPSYIYLADGIVYVKETNAGTPIAISSNRVVVDSLAFTKRTHEGAHSIVSVALEVSYNTSNIQQMFTRQLLTSVRRVSAAVFDSNIVPNVSNTYKLGASQGDWQSINNTIYFSGSNVGIGITDPGQKLEVNGGVMLDTTSARLPCNPARRGLLWFTQSGSGVSDSIDACMRDADNNYNWTPLY